MSILLDKFNVIFSSAYWDLSGVNTVSVNLIRGLRASGVSAKILRTKPYKEGVNPMPFPSDIPVDKLPVNQRDTWPNRWDKMIRYLEKQSPCIYIPNYDWDHSCISPKLSNKVIIVGIIHSDDPLHYEHISRLGNYWNAIVAVSKTLQEKTAEKYPHLTSQLLTIPNGVSIPNKLPQRLLKPKIPLKIVYTGRLVSYQKRVFDLPKIIFKLLEKQVKVHLKIIGDGKDANELKEICQPLIEQGSIEFLGTLPNEKVLDIYQENDVFLLTSDFEGMPISLLEAMGRGCIPVVTDIASGIPELVHHGVNGFRVPIGDIEQFADLLTVLHQNLNRRQEMALNAYQKISEGGYRTEDMVKQYINLFEWLREQVVTGLYQRHRGQILPPPQLRNQLHTSWKNQLPSPILKLGNYGKRLFNLLYSDG